MGWNPSEWVSLIPNGMGHVKPNHYLDILRTIWRNRYQLPYALRILKDGVCDGCALGTTGMRDFTMDGIHLCTVRLNLLEMNTMSAMDGDVLKEVSTIKNYSSAKLRKLGRLAYPMVRQKGEPGFRKTSWAYVLSLLGKKIREVSPDRLAFYLTSRGITNEVYYVAQKAARFLGTNNVDNSSRICHAPSTKALQDTLGVGASTCSYTDWIGTDLLILIGSDVPNNQPVTTKYMYYAKKHGTRIIVINPYKEPGLQRYWVPSVFESALFGTKLADEFFQVHTGGDIAFVNGVLKHLIENDWIDAQFISSHTSGFEELSGHLEGQSWEILEQRSGCSRENMLRFARLYGQAKSAVIVWSMGITQHSFGVDNVKALINLALSKGMIGREKCGLMPIRGHSGVQGGAEMGAVPWSYPGGEAVSAEGADKLKKLWGFNISEIKGLSAVEMIDGSYNGDIDVLYSLGGNFLETLPDREYVRTALEKVPLRIHQDIVITSQMLLDPSETVVLLPARTRYEQPGGGTETSTERRVYFNPEIPGRRIGEAMSEWEILMKVAEHVHPNKSNLIHYDSADEIRLEISKVIPQYAGIELLKAKGDSFQWGGVRLCEQGDFKTNTGYANFTPLTPPEIPLKKGWFLLSTRRGKQFNTMIYDQRDPITGANREDVLISEIDAKVISLKTGDPVVLKSDAGEFHGICRIAPIRAGNLQVHWPEGSVLLKRGVLDKDSGIPNYNALVKLIRMEERNEK